jgi:hypothetical protein
MHIVTLVDKTSGHPHQYSFIFSFGEEGLYERFLTSLNISNSTKIEKHMEK